MLERLRNMWQFANLCQWLTIFGGAVKVEVFDIEVRRTPFMWHALSLTLA